MITEVTSWKVRHWRQQEAKKRDKQQIAQLKRKIQELEWSLWWWNRWWMEEGEVMVRREQNARQGDGRVVWAKEAAAAEEEVSTVLYALGEQPSHSVIDYSQMGQPH